MSIKRPPKYFKNYERHGVNDAGYGSFGKVYFYHLKEDHMKIVAVKVIEEDNIRKDELEILKQCTHKNIVEYIDCENKEGLWFIVTELLNSSLYDALHCSKDSLFVLTQRSNGCRINQTQFLPKLNEYEMLSIAEDCFQGLLYLHDNNIIHRDIWPANILLEVIYTTDVRKITGKLCDFGLSKQGTAGHQTALENIYSAPECTNPNVLGYSIKADVFSMGVVLAEMIYDLAGINKKLFQSRFENNTRREWSNTVRYGNRFGSKKAVKYKDIYPIVMDMTKENPDERANIHEAYTKWTAFYNLKNDAEDENEYDDDEGKGGIEMEDGELMDVVEESNLSELQRQAIAQFKSSFPHLTENEILQFAVSSEASDKSKK